MLKLTPHVVAFIDILGYRELIKNNSSIMELEDLASGFQRIFTDIIKDIKKPEFDIELKLPNNAKIPEQPKMKCLQIGDALFLYSQVTHDPYSVQAQIIRMISTIGLIQARILVRGPEICKQLVKDGVMSRPLMRGAISVGPHYNEGNFIFSKALIEAYELEKQIKQPVVVISEGAFNFFKEKIFQCNNFLQNYLLFEKHNIKYPFINYLKFFDGMESQKYILFQLMDGHKKALQCNIKFAKEKNLKRCVFDKLRWLTQYHNYFVEQNNLETNLLFQDEIRDVSFEKFSFNL